MKITEEQYLNTVEKFAINWVTILSKQKVTRTINQIIALANEAAFLQMKDLTNRLDADINNCTKRDG